MPRSKLALASYVLALAYWLLIFALTHLPPLGVGGPNGLPADGKTDKVAHCVCYAGLAFLLSVAAFTRWGGRRSQAFFVLVVVATYGLFDEWSQIFTPYHEFDWNDWVADVLGAGIGLAAFGLVGEPILARLRPQEPLAEDLAAETDAASA